MRWLIAYQSLDLADGMRVYTEPEHPVPVTPAGMAQAAPQSLAVILLT